MSNTILLIENDLLLQEIYKNFLTRCGYEVITTERVSKAVLLSFVFDIDLIIVDLILDDTNDHGYTGADAATIINKIKPECKIIFISAQDDLHSWLDGFDIKYCAKEMKPLLPHELLRIVEQCLAKPAVL